MKQKQIRKTIAGAAAAAAVLGGTVVLAENYQSGNRFRPNGSDQDIQANQVVFSENENRTGESRQKDDSSLWQKDNTSREQNGPQNQNGSGYLFKGDQMTTDAANTLNLADSSGPSMVSDMNGGNTVYDVISDASRADQIIVSGGSKNPTGGNGGVGGQTGSTGTQRPDSGNGSDSTTTRPASSAKDPELSYGNKNNPPLGSSDLLYVNQPYKEDFTPATDADGNPMVVIVKSTSYGDDGVKLYEGQSVSRKELYYSLDTYVVGANYNRYLWGADALDKYVRIDGISFDGGKTYVREFPVTIPFGLEEGQMIIQVSYRFSTASEKWEQKNVSYDPESSRIFVLSREIKKENTTITTDMIVNSYDQYLSAGAKLNLFGLQDDFLGGTDTVLTALFPGWMEDGKPVPWMYPVKEGRHILEPADMVPLSDAYTVKIGLYWMTEDYDVDFDNGKLCYLQTLRNYESDTLIERAAGALGVQRRYGWKVKVPKYVQAVDFEAGSSVIVEDIEIPDTVLYINADGSELQVYRSWKVDKDNPKYASTEDGMLMDKAETEILGIPEHISEIRIPDGITSIKLTKNNQLTQIHMEMDSVEKIPDLEYDNLSNCTLIVKDELLEAYLESHQEILAQGDRLSAAAESDPEKIWWFENDVLMNSDGELVRSMGNSRVIKAPESTEKIRKNAFAGSKADTVILPPDQDDLVLEEDCFADSAVQTVLCHTKKQYEAVEKQIGSSGAGEDIQVELMLTSREGFAYSRVNRDGAEIVTLLTAPENIREFDGTVTAEDGSPVTLTAIGDNAFAGCEALQWVTLPESVSRIGYQAFRNCTSLEGLLIDAREEIHMGNKSLDGCYSLRFVASNARRGEMEDDYAPVISDSYGVSTHENYYFYVPSNPEGYGSTCVAFEAGDDVEEYRMVSIGGDGRMLYGVGKDGDTWLALRSGLQVAEQVKLPEDTLEMYRYAMADTRTASGESYTVNWDELPTLMYLDAGVFKNASLGGMVTIRDASLGDEVFNHCTRVRELHFPGTMKYLGSAVFGNCSSLEKIYMGNTTGGYGTVSLMVGEFTGCDSLRELHFEGDTLIDLMMESQGYGFRFNADWEPEEEKEKLRLYMPNVNPEDFAKKWRYLFAGYFYNGFSTAYSAMWTDTYWNNITYDDNWNMNYPEEKQIDAIVKEKLLTAENRIRVMMGIPEVAEPVDYYPYHTDDDGYMTLVDAPSYLTEVTLDGDTLDLPEGWCIDYIGTGAFSGSKNLKKVIIPAASELAGTITGIYPDAFSGVESDSLTLEFESESPAELLWNGSDTFSFGIDDDRLHLVVPAGSEEDYLSAFLWHMAGYENELQLRRSIVNELTDEEGNVPAETVVDAEMQKRLLPVYNRLRRMMGLEPSDRVDILAISAETDPMSISDSGISGNTETGTDDGEGADKETENGADSEGEKAAEPEAKKEETTETDVGPGVQEDKAE